MHVQRKKEMWEGGCLWNNKQGWNILEFILNPHKISNPSDEDK